MSVGQWQLEGTGGGRSREDVRRGAGDAVAGRGLVLCCLTTTEDDDY